MKKTISSLFAVFLIFIVSFPASAVSITINDNYIGGNSNNPGNIANNEVIGDDEFWAVSHMDVDRTGSALTVDIHSQFFNNISYHNVYMGDLFISTDGWNPYGTGSYNADISPYKVDETATAGEDWEYVLNLDYNRYTEYSDTSGTFTLYAVDPVLGTVMFPEDQPEEYRAEYYRAGQEIYYNPYDGQVGLGSGSWSIHNLGSSDDTDDFLRFELISDFFSDYDELGLRWEMTCANDVIEGSVENIAPVPEPSTIILLGAGIVGLAGSRYRKHKKV